MQYCNRCLENNFTYKKLDTGDILAVCNFCGHEAQFTPRRKIKKAKLPAGYIFNIHGRIIKE